MLVKSLADITARIEDRAIERLLRQVRFMLARQSPDVRRGVLVELARDMAAAERPTQGSQPDMREGQKDEDNG
jgi:hypothetical protein